MNAIIIETDEQIKRRKKGIGSKNHSVLQQRIIIQIALKYLGVFEAIPELSILINGKEKIPDLSFYKKIKTTPGNDIIKMEELPLGVIEILSPTQNITELAIKANDYFDAGIASYWLVLPELESIYVYSSKGEHQVYTYRDTLIDTKLDIELNLMKVFR